MPLVCRARVCQESTPDIDTIKFGHHFRFPADLDRCRVWVERSDLKLKNLEASVYNKGYRLCAEHFERSQFTNELKNRLNKTAIPTIFGDKIYELVDAEGNKWNDVGFKIQDSFITQTLGRSDVVVSNPEIDLPSTQAENKVKAFVAHKSRLAEASPKLAAMLDCPHDETRGYRMLELDIDEEVCCQLLRFIYLGQLGHVEDKVKLLEVAKEFEVAALFKVIQKVIEMTDANAVDMFMLAVKLDADELKSKAIEYINSHCDAVMLTAGWSTMLSTQPQLLATLYKSITREVTT